MAPMNFKYRFLALNDDITQLLIVLNHDLHVGPWNIKVFKVLMDSYIQIYFRIFIVLNTY